MNATLSVSTATSTWMELYTLSCFDDIGYICWMGFAVRVRSAGQKYGPTCHQRDRADVTEFVTLVRLSSLGQHVGVLALAGYKRRKSALTAGPIAQINLSSTKDRDWNSGSSHQLQKGAVVGKQADFAVHYQKSIQISMRLGSRVSLKVP